MSFCRVFLFILALIALPSNVFSLERNIESLNQYATATNRNFKVYFDDRPIFLRLGRENPEEIGIDREVEVKFYSIAEKLGIAPELLAYETNNGLLLSSFIEGAALSENEIHDLATIEKVIDNFHLLHRYSAEEQSLEISTIFSRNDHLIAQVKHFESYGEIKAYIDLWLLVRGEFQNQHYQSIPLGVCHGDLFRGNIMQDRFGKIYFIDWEYSFYGYVLDDLGKFCASNWLKKEEIEFVSAKYWNVYDTILLTKLYQNIFMQQFNFFLWCHIQADKNSQNSHVYYQFRDAAAKHMQSLIEQNAISSSLPL